MTLEKKTRHLHSTDMETEAEKVDEAVRVLEGLAEKYGPSISIGALHAMLITLRRLAAGERPTVGEIAAGSYSSRQTVSRWLAHHVEHGWIRLVANPDDARETLVCAADEDLVRQSLAGLQSLVRSARPDSPS